MGFLWPRNGVRVVHGPHVVELDGGHGPVGLDGLGQHHDGLHVEGGHGVATQYVQAVLVAPGILVVDEALGDGDLGKAAPGLGLIDVDALRGGIAVVDTIRLVVMGDASTRFLKVTPLMVMGKNIWGYFVQLISSSPAFPFFTVFLYCSKRARNL